MAETIHAVLDRARIYWASDSRKSIISFRSPLEIWAENPTFLLVEVTFLVWVTLTMKHALRSGGRFSQLWCAALLHGLVIELLSYTLPDVDNFWHFQGTAVLFNTRLPLYITFLYPCFYYTAYVAVSRLKLSVLLEPFALAICVVLLDVPYDILGVKLLWWTWHDTDPNLYDRTYYVPWTSYMFHLTFASTFLLILNTSRVLLSCGDSSGEKGEGGTSGGGCASFVGVVLAGCLSMPLAVLGQMLPAYNFPHDVYGIHTEVLLWTLLGTYVVLVWIGTQGSEGRESGGCKGVGSRVYHESLVYHECIGSLVYRECIGSLVHHECIGSLVYHECIGSLVYHECIGSLVYRECIGSLVHHECIGSLVYCECIGSLVYRECIGSLVHHECIGSLVYHECIGSLVYHECIGSLVYRECIGSLVHHECIGSLVYCECIGSLVYHECIGSLVYHECIGSLVYHECIGSLVCRECIGSLVYHECIGSLVYHECIGSLVCRECIGSLVYHECIGSLVYHECFGSLVYHECIGSLVYRECIGSLVYHECFGSLVYHECIGSLVYCECIGSLEYHECIGSLVYRECIGSLVHHECIGSLVYHECIGSLVYRECIGSLVYHECIGSLVCHECIGSLVYRECFGSLVYPSSRRHRSTEVCVALVVYYTCIGAVLMVGARPETYSSTGLHQTIGNCSVIAHTTNVLGQKLPKQAYLCASSYDEPFSLLCANAAHPATNGASYYTICGTSFPNSAEYKCIIVAACMLGAAIYYQLLFRSGMKAQKQKKN
eukprot:Em0002g1158a